MGYKMWVMGVIIVGVAIAVKGANNQSGFINKDKIFEFFKQLNHDLGMWALPVYVLLHTITLALCLPYAVFFEAGASLLFGFFTAVVCVFTAKILGASLSFWIGRLIFMNSSSAREWAQKNKHFHVLSKGVEQDGWKFVLLARFSPIPSYVINYALAATKVRYFVDFLLPSVIGCLPMILQNTSIGSLAGAAVASASGSQKSQLWSYVFPLMGIVSSVIISLRIRKYCKNISTDVSSNDEINTSGNTLVSTQPLASSKNVEKSQ